MGKITSVFSKVEVSESTVGIDMASSVKILDNEIDASIAIWDFAGQPQYTATHQVRVSMKKSSNCQAVLRIFQYNLFLSCGSHNSF